MVVEVSAKKTMTCFTVLVINLWLSACRSPRKREAAPTWQFESGVGVALMLMM